MGPVPPVEVQQRSHQEWLELLSVLLPAPPGQVHRQWPGQVEAVDLLPAQWVSTAPTAGARAALRRQSLATSLVPGNPLLWPAWCTGTFTERTGAGAGSARTATAAAALRIHHTREIPLLRDWRVRPLDLLAPTAARAHAAAPPAQTRSAVPAAARVAGE